MYKIDIYIYIYIYIIYIFYMIYLYIYICKCSSRLGVLFFVPESIGKRGMIHYLSAQVWATALGLMEQLGSGEEELCFNVWLVVSY